MQHVSVIEVNKTQALNILIVLDALHADVLIERTPLGGCHVAVTLPNGQTSMHAGSNLSDALGQAAATLGLDNDVDLPCWIGEPKEFAADADKPIELVPQSLLYSDAPLEFCQRFIVVDDSGEKSMAAHSGLKEAV